MELDRINKKVHEIESLENFCHDLNRFQTKLYYHRRAEVLLNGNVITSGTTEEEVLRALERLERFLSYGLKLGPTKNCCSYTWNLNLNENKLCYKITNEEEQKCLSVNIGGPQKELLRYFELINQFAKNYKTNDETPQPKFFIY